MTGHRIAAKAAAGESGFTLLEVLLAFVVFSLTLAALLQLFSSALRDAQLADEYARAVVIAQSKLDEATALESPQEGAQSGEETPFRWAVDTAPYDERQETEQGQSGPDMPLRLRLLRIESSVSWQGADGRARNVRLATLHLETRR